MAKPRNMAYWESEEGLAELKGLSELTFGGVATRIGIKPSTLISWCRKSYAIHDALPQYQRQMTLEAENAVLELCFGQVKTARIKEQKMAKDGSVYDLVTEKADELPGDLRALKYWLNNRDPEHWRDKPSPVEEEGGEEIPSFIPVPDRMEIPDGEEE